MKKINFNHLVLLGIILTGLILRVINIDSYMHFISDQGWFYVSARDMILNKEIPLVGITSSHIWLHQGAYWTYVLGIIFMFFDFNPVIPGYFSALLGSMSIFLVYLLAKDLVNEKVGLISSFIFAVSPAVIMDSRLAYHTTPIPFFTILLLLSIYKWIKGSYIFFPIALFITAILYNFEIATLSLFGVLFVVLIYGFYNKKIWFKKLLNKKTIIYSIFAVLVPMLPMLIYDLSNNFSQTLKVGVWMVYKVLVSVGLYSTGKTVESTTWSEWIAFNTEVVGKTIFYPSTLLSILIFIASVFFLLIVIQKKLKKKKEVRGLILVLISVVIPILAYMVTKTNSAAYIPMFYPQVIIMVGFLIYSLFISKKTILVGFILLVFLAIGNINMFLNKDFVFIHGIEYRKNVVKKIIADADGKPYNIIGRGEASIYESYLTPYEYLAWWYGSPPSHNPEELKFYIREHKNGIEVTKK